MFSPIYETPLATDEVPSTVFVNGTDHYQVEVTWHPVAVLEDLESRDIEINFRTVAQRNLQLLSIIPYFYLFHVKDLLIFFCYHHNFNLPSSAYSTKRMFLELKVLGSVRLKPCVTRSKGSRTSLSFRVPVFSAVSSFNVPRALWSHNKRKLWNAKVTESTSQVGLRGGFCRPSWTWAPPGFAVLMQVY